jgi:UDP-GlcNAc:undecaprenyl-phosphate/decaprenyl-phosphate GlcNAc-1-phosphate transferase
VREYVLTLLVAAAVSYLLTPLVRRGAMRAGAMHEARDRDVHVVPIPLFGGLAMYGGLAAGLLVASQLPYLNSVFAGNRMALGLLLSGGLIVLIGMVDDRWGLNPISKFAGQVAAGAILVATGTELSWLPLPGGNTFSPDPNQAMVLTILVVVATINAVNFIDGLDGLAAGIVAIAATSFFLYYYTLTHVLRLSAEAGPALVAAILAGMCIGFLPHNFYPARIFMGDTGSMLLGLLLAYVPIASIASLDQSSLVGAAAYRAGAPNRFPEILPLLPPAMILVIPYADMLLAVIRRTRSGMSPFAPDRKHLHHRLLDIGHSHRRSVLIMYLWAALFSGTIVWLSVERTALLVFAVITLAAVLSLLLMSMPRLRWWQRRSGAAAAPRAVPRGTVGGARAPVPAVTSARLAAAGPGAPTLAAPDGAMPGVATPGAAAPADQPAPGRVALADKPGPASSGPPPSGPPPSGPPPSGPLPSGPPPSGPPPSGPPPSGPALRAVAEAAGPALPGSPGGSAKPSDPGPSVVGAVPPPEAAGWPGEG